MSDLGWFAVFATIAILMAAISLWMVWYSRRAMRVHKDQIHDMIREMKEAIEETRPPDAERHDDSDPA